MTGERLSCGHNYKYEVGCDVCASFEAGRSAYKDGRGLSEAEFYSGPRNEKTLRGWRDGWNAESVNQARLRYDLDSVKRNGPKILGQS